MIEVVQTPPLNSVQDDGRVGFRGFGIGRSGAMDHVALAAANALLGNEENAAAIELQLYPFAVKFHSDTLFVLTGATARAKLDGVAVLPWWVTPARGGQKLVVSEPVDGLRTYLAIAGGVEVPVILGSRSTQLRDGFGGFEGRSLKAGDQLEVGHAAPVTLRDLGGYGASPALSELPSATWAGSSPGGVILRVITASEYDLFDESSKTAFWTTPWTISTKSSRMGYHLTGATLCRTHDVEMRSHPIVPGVIQVPPSGDPVIQLADGNSAGGYPKIGVVIEPDLWRIGQARPGQCLHFVRCSFAEARDVERVTRSYIEEIRRLAKFCRCSPRAKLP